MRRRDHNIFANATSLLICGLLAGVVVAAAAFPAAAMSGLAAKAGGQTFARLPSELRAFTSPQVTRVYASDNKTLIAVMYDEFRSDVKLKDISPNMQKAIIAAEDRTFYEHNGVDVKGVARAFVSNNNGKTGKQGASTITMQQVRLSLAYSATSPQEVVDATEDTVERKVNEIKLAMQLEKSLTKEQILERYLNIAPFGNQAYGVFAASQVYFNKHPRNLTVAESALLAGMVKAPTSYNPTTAAGYPQAVDRRQYVLDGMVEIGAITKAQAAEAAATKIPRTVRRVGNGCVSVAKNQWGFFCDYFYRWWMSQEAFGATSYDRERRLKGGGYRIVTSLDVKAQAAARKRIGEHAKESERNALLLAAVEPGTGRVRVLAANRKFKLDDPNKPQNPITSDPAKAAQGVRATYPNTTNPLITGGGDIKGYQAGSVFKMFTMIAALEKGYPLSYTIKAERVYRSGYIIEKDSPAACPGTNFYCPTNSDKKGEGVYNMWTAFGNSINTYFVPLQERVNSKNVIDVAKRFGVKFRDPDDARRTTDEGGNEQWGAFTLGVADSTPLDMANAYATLAADGKYCEPTPIQRITTLDGETLDVGKPHCNQATSADVARAAIDAARCPVGDNAQLGQCNGTTARGSSVAIDHPIFGKTGTTDAERTAALIVGTTSLVVAGYLVNPDWPGHTDKMDHDVVNPAVWDTVADAMQGKPQEEFKKPGDEKLATGDQRSIPDVTCWSEDEARSRLQGAGFEVDRGPDVESDCPEGTVAGTSPDGQTIKGGVVILEISNGRREQPVPDQTAPQGPDTLPSFPTPGEGFPRR